MFVRNRYTVLFFNIFPSQLTTYKDSSTFKLPVLKKLKVGKWRRLVALLAHVVTSLHLTRIDNDADNPHNRPYYIMYWMIMGFFFLFSSFLPPVPFPAVYKWNV